MKIVQRYGYQKVTCPKCSSVLEICADDIEFDESGHIGYYYYCPVCKNHVTLRTGDVPKKWIEVVDEKYD